MQLVAGISSLDIPGLLAAARRRIVLHAAVYTPFAASKPHCDALAEALACPEFTRLDIIALAPEQETGWNTDFLPALRFGAAKEDVKEEISASTVFADGLVAAYPGKVRVHPATIIPCFPVLIIDDTIIFGQYAHASVYAPQGYWGVVTADVETLFDRAAEGNPPADANTETLAAYRIISECFQAMHPSTTQRHGSYDR